MKNANQSSTSLAQVGAALAVLTESIGNAKLHIQQARLFLHVASHGEALQGSLEAVARIAQSSVSRNLSLLANGLHGRKPGYGLLEVQEVPHYRRSNVVRLTEKGKALAWDMQQALGGALSNAPQRS